MADPAFIEAIRRHPDLSPRMNLLVDTLIALSDADGPVAADLEALRAELGRREGAEVPPATLRQRLKRLNDALEGDAPFQLVTRSGRVSAMPTARWEETGRAAELKRRIVEHSTNELRLDEGAIVPPRARPDTLTVMLSYAWLPSDQHAIQLEFVEAVKRKLALRPPEFDGLPRIKLWQDDVDLDRTAPQRPQFDAACSEAFLGLILYSDKYRHSDACLHEAGFFLTADGDNQGRKRALVVRVNGSLDTVEPRFKSRIVEPVGGPSLIEVWARANPAEKLALAERVAHQIFKAAAAWLSEDGLPPPTRRAAIDEALAERGSRLEHDDCLTVAPRARPNGIGLTIGAVAAIDESGGIAIVDHLVAWAKSRAFDRPRLSALLGDFGMGKTVTCQLLVRRLLEESRTDADVPMPVYLDLRKVRRPEREEAIDLDYLVCEMLRVPGLATPDAREVVRFVRERGALVVFDGLDEITNKLSVDAARRVYRELLSLVPGDIWRADAERRRTKKSLGPQRGPSIVISCRSQYFADFAAERGFLTDADRSGLDAGADMAAYVMLPFNAEQVEAYLEKNLTTGEAARVSGLLDDTYKLRELAARPILLRYISEMVDRLEREKLEGRPINITSLYDILVEQAFQRDESKHVIPIVEKKRLLQALAHYFHHSGRDEIDHVALGDWLDAQIMAHHPRLARALEGAEGLTLGEVLAQDFRNATLLSRPGETGFRFGHTSMREYFLADALFHAADGAAQFWSTSRPSRETIDFLMKRREASTPSARERFDAGLATLLAAGTPAMARHLALTVWLHAHASGVLLPRPRQMDLSGLELNEQIFSGRPDQLLPLQNSLWVGAALRQADFAHADLAGANFAKADLRGARVSACPLTGARFSEAALDGSCWHYCDLDAFALGNATTAHVEATACRVGGSVWAPQLANVHIPRAWQPVPRRPHMSTRSIGALELDGRWTLAVGTDAGEVWLYDASSGALAGIIATGNGPVNALAVADPSKPVLVVGDQTGRVSVWDVQTKQLVRVLGNADHRVQAISTGVIGGYWHAAAVIRCPDQAITILSWCIETGEKLDLQLPDVLNLETVLTIADGSVLGCSIDQRNVVLRDFMQGSIRWQRGLSATGEDKFRLNFGQFCGQSCLVVAGGTDEVGLWDLASGRTVASFSQPNSEFDTAAAFDVCGRGYVAAATHQGKSVIWDADSRQTIEDTGIGGSVAFIAGGNEAFCGFVSLRPIGGLTVYSLRGSATRHLHLSTRSYGNLEMAAFEHAGERLMVFAGPDRYLRIVRAIDGGIVHDVDVGGPVIALAHLVHRGRPIVLGVVHPGDTVIELDAATGQVTHRFEGMGRVVSGIAAASVAGRPVFAVVSDQSRVVLFDLDTKAVITSQPAKVPIDIIADLVDVAGSPTLLFLRHGISLSMLKLDGKTSTLTIASDDELAGYATGRWRGRPIVAVGDTLGAVTLYDLKDGARIDALALHQDWVRGLALLEIDGETILLSGGDDGHIVVCSLDRGPLGSVPLLSRNWVFGLNALGGLGDLTLIAAVGGYSTEVLHLGPTLEPERVLILSDREEADMLLSRATNGWAIERLGREAWRGWQARVDGEAGQAIVAIADVPRAGGATGAAARR